MRELETQCKNCGRQFSYSETAARLTLEGGESYPLRCEACRKTHGKEMRELSAAFIPIEPSVRSTFLLEADAGTYRTHITREAIEHQPDIEGMQFGITDEYLEMLFQHLRDNRVVIMVSGTGSGKSTLVPARLIDPPKGPSRDFLNTMMRQGKIAITEPRIASVQRVTDAIGRILGTDIGPNSVIGYRHGSRPGENPDEGEQWNRYNRAIVVTDGTLRNWIRNGDIRKYSLIIVDEAHERNKNIELLLLFLKRALQTYDHLRVLISSATINRELFVNSFSEIGVSTTSIELPSKKAAKYHGPHFWKSVEQLDGCDCWLCQMRENDRQRFWDQMPERVGINNMADSIAALTIEIATRTTGYGSVLVFLHGQSDIDRTGEILSARLRKENIDVIPIYSNLGQDKVDKHLSKAQRRRCVVLATNIAETSLTIPNLTYVIDSGLIKENRWDHNAKTEKLFTRYHSRDGCRQRWGRVGRTHAGYVFTLYTRQQFDEEFQEHSDPAITRERLDDIMVAVAGAGMDDFESLPWIDQPDDTTVEQTKRIVHDTASIDEYGDLTERGAMLLRVPLPAQVVSLANAACQLGCLVETLMFLLTAFTKDGSVRFKEYLYDRQDGLLVWDTSWDPRTKYHVLSVHNALRIGCHDDVDYAIKLFQCFVSADEEGRTQQWAMQHYLNMDTLQRIRNDFANYCEKLYAENAEDPIRSFDFDRLHTVRKILREHLADTDIHVTGEDEGNRPRKEMYLDQDIPIGSQVQVIQNSNTPSIEHPKEAFQIEAEWIGQVTNNTVFVWEWLSTDGGPVARISSLSESAVSTWIAKSTSYEVSVWIRSIERDAYGNKGIAMLKDDQGIEFPVGLETLTLSHTGIGVEDLIGENVTLDIIDSEEDGRPVLSNTCRIIHMLNSMFKEFDSAYLNGWIASHEPSIAQAKVVVRHGQHICGFDLFKYQAIESGRIEDLVDGETVLLELTKVEGYRHLLKQLEPEEQQTLPTSFVYDEEEGKILFPNCVSPKVLKGWKACGTSQDEVLRTAWQYGLRVRVKSLKDRLRRIQRGQIATLTVHELIYSKEDPDKLTGVRLLFQDGTPVFLPDRFAPTIIRREGVTDNFIVRKVEPDRGKIDVEHVSVRYDRLQGSMDRLREPLERKQLKLHKQKRNLEYNYNRLTTAKTSRERDKRERFIAEDRQRIASLENDISDIQKKIDAIRKELRQLKRNL